MRILALIYFLGVSLVHCNGQNKVIISGSCACEKGSQISLRVQDDAILIHETDLVKKTSPEDNSFSFILNINTPVIGFINNQKIYISPGDSISLMLNNPNEQGYFSGKNSAHYTLFSELGKFRKTHNNPVLIKFDEASLQEYKTSLIRKRNDELVFAEDYLKENSHSFLFEEVVEDYLITSYLNDLIYPFYNRAINTLPINYLEDINSAMLNKESLLAFREYILFLNRYSIFSVLQASGSNASPELISSTIEEIYVGHVQFAQKLFFLSNLMLKGIDHQNLIQKLYLEIKENASTNQYNLTMLNRMMDTYSRLGKPLTPELLQMELIDTEGKLKTLGNVLKNHSGKSIYIDFWASWCGPCIEEMPASEKLDAELSKSANVAFIYVSIDKNPDNWQKGLQKIKVGKYHYRAGKVTAEAIKSYFDFSSIPRYGIINKIGLLYSYDASRPSENEKLKNIFLNDSLK